MLRVPHSHLHSFKRPPPCRFLILLPNRDILAIITNPHNNRYTYLPSDMLPDETEKVDFYCILDPRCRLCRFDIADGDSAIGMSLKFLPNSHELKDQKLHTILASFASPSHGGYLSAMVPSASICASATFVSSSAIMAAIFHRSTKIATNLSRDPSLKLFCLQLATNFVPLLGTDNVGRLRSNKSGYTNSKGPGRADYLWSWWPKLRPGHSANSLSPGCLHVFLKGTMVRRATEARIARASLTFHCPYMPGILPSTEQYSWKNCGIRASRDAGNVRVE
jgi:hypothetical protein